MKKNASSSEDRRRTWLHKRGVLFWVATLTAASVALLFIGSQIAVERGQSVYWYAGFGQWLGALASFIAACAALWIASSDRKRAVKQQNADLAREAGLVQVTAEMLGKAQLAGLPSIPTAAIGIKNRRTGRIFDIEVAKFIHGGEAMKLEIARLYGFAVHPPRAEEPCFAAQLPALVLESDELLVLYQQDSLPDTPADFAAVRYTDSVGRRWEVDTEGKVTRL